MLDIAEHIKTIGPDFVINTGDTADTSVATQYTDYLAAKAISGKTWYEVPGSHDEGLGLDPTGDTPGQTATWDTYDAAGLPRHWTADVGPVRFIGINTYLTRNPAALRRTAISAGEKAWLINELTNLGGQVPVVVNHDSITSIKDSGTWDTIYEDLIGYGVVAFLSGHGHYYSVSMVSGIPNVMNDSVVATGMMVIYVLSDRLIFEYSMAHYPFSLYTPTTTPAFNGLTVML